MKNVFLSMNPAFKGISLIMIAFGFLTSVKNF